MNDINEDQLEREYARLEPLLDRYVAKLRITRPDLFDEDTLKTLATHRNPEMSHIEKPMTALANLRRMFLQGAELPWRRIDFWQNVFDIVEYLIFSVYRRQ